jgi:translation elongation factor EF-Tu-like GTPase
VEEHDGTFVDTTGKPEFADHVANLFAVAANGDEEIVVLDAAR